MRTVVGVFPSRTEAELVARDLKALGIPSDDLSIADGKNGVDHREWSQRNIAAVGGLSFGWLLAGLIPVVADRNRSAATGFGALAGGLTGAVAGLLALAIPRTTLLVAGSQVATVIAGLIIGALAGAVIAMTYNMGVSHEDVPLVREAVREHGVVVAAHVDRPRASDVLRVMNEHGAHSLRAGADAWTASGWTGPHILRSRIHPTARSGPTSRSRIPEKLRNYFPVAGQYIPG